MRRATPPEQVQTVPLTLHDEGQVGCTVECDHRKGTERGLLPTPSSLGIHREIRARDDSIQRFHDGCISKRNTLPEVNPRWMTVELRPSDMFRCDDGREEEGAGDEGENNEQAHQHEEILEAREGCQEACCDSRNSRDGGFKNGLTGFLNG